MQLLWGAAEAIREPLSPVLSFYAEGLRLVNRWGMFTAPSQREAVEILSVDGRGREALVMSTAQRRDGLLNAIRDVRMRKLQSRLSDPAASVVWRSDFLTYVCRQSSARDASTRAVRVRGVTPLALDDSGRQLASSSERIIAEQRCEGQK
jgi:hypothetical protein